MSSFHPSKICEREPNRLYQGGLSWFRVEPPMPLPDSLSIDCLLSLIAIDPLQEVLRQRTRETQIKRDKHTVLHSILRHREYMEDRVDGDRRRISMRTMLRHYTKYEQDLVELGTRVIQPSRGGHHEGENKVFMHPDTVREHCLKDSEFGKKNVKDYLLQLPGAQADRQNLNGSNLRGVSIPYREICGRKEEE